MDLRLDRASSVPLGTQLENRLRAAIADGGGLAPGDRLPSLRHVAAEAGVNVNTVRAVYARLESAGAIVTEQGRGTFVAGGEAAGSPAGAADRRALREQIARLEAELARLPVPRPGAEPTRPPAAAGLLSTAELAAVRDALLDRLRELDAARAEVVRRLDALDDATSRDDATSPPVNAAAPSTRRSSSTLSGARVRWVGA